MKSINSDFIIFAKDYLSNLGKVFTTEKIDLIHMLANDLGENWKEGRNVFLCGNGGSAANALHIANDFIYGVGACGEAPMLPGIKVEALPSNPGVITCLANDMGFENIYSNQIKVKGQERDILIALSGSGNSSNIVNAIEQSKEIGIKTYAILGFTGGTCLEIADFPIHFNINDMQIAEDCQLIVGHLCMQWLNANKQQILLKL